MNVTATHRRVSELQNSKQILIWGPHIDSYEEYDLLGM
jgi:hypothetical protein